MYKMSVQQVPAMVHQGPSIKELILIAIMGGIGAVLARFLLAPILEPVGQGVSRWQEGMTTRPRSGKLRRL